MASFYSCGYKGDTCGLPESPFETKLFPFNVEFQAKSA